MIDGRFKIRLMGRASRQRPVESVAKLIFLVLFLAFTGSTCPACSETLDANHGRELPRCAGIWFDLPAVTTGSSSDASKPGKIGRNAQIHAIYLQNLLGHFPGWEPRPRPIESYQSGQLDECRVNFYIGLYYDNKLPQPFLIDALSSRSTLVWFGYNAWQIDQPKFGDVFGAQFHGLTGLDSKINDDSGIPGFFRFNSYKGQKFTKFAQWSKDEPKKLIAAWELNHFKVVRPDEVRVVSDAIHSTSGERIPYATVKKADPDSVAVTTSGQSPGSRWLFAESPFAFMMEDDRYLIFCDLLFDVLSEKPRRPDTKRLAFFRVEDVHPSMPLWQIKGMIDLLHQEKVPFAISTIPLFSDPFLFATPDLRDSFVPMTARPATIAVLKHAVEESNASIIMHGVSHQSGPMRNPFNGMSGDDFEFWNRVTNTPMAEDSPSWVVRRLELGLDLLHKSGLFPVAWLTPHYQASPLDYAIFGQLFRWNVGRVIYFPGRVNFPGRPVHLLSRMDDPGSPSTSQQRLSELEGVSVDFAGQQQGVAPSGQFFPYEIYRDFWGQRLIPENIGNLQPYMNEQVISARSVDDMIENARRALVVRDAWASFFVHPLMLESRRSEGVGNYPGDGSEIRRLIRSIRALGYEFVDLNEWVRENSIEVEHRYVGNL